MRRKSVVFSVIFSLLFLALLSIAILSREGSREDSRSFVSSRRIYSVSALSDSFAQGAIRTIGLSRVSISRNSTNYTVSFSDSFPSQAANPSAEFQSFTSFFSSDYSRKMNLNSTVDSSYFEQNPRISLSEFNYSYGSLSKNSLSISGKAPIAYSISASYSGGGALNTSDWSWASCASSCAGGNIRVSLLISNGTTSASPSGCSEGCISPSGTIRLGFNSSSPEILNISFSSGLLSMGFSPSSAVLMNLSVMMDGTNSTEATLPIVLTIPNSTAGATSNLTSIVVARG